MGIGMGVKRNKKCDCKKDCKKITHIAKDKVFNVLSFVLLVICFSNTAMLTENNLMQLSASTLQDENVTASSYAKTADSVIKHEKIVLEELSLRCGNTSQFLLPEEIPENAEITGKTDDPEVADIIAEYIVAGTPGKTKVIYTAVLGNEIWTIEQPVKVIVSTFFLKSYANNKYVADAVRTLENNPNVTVSVGKTARILASVGKGTFTGISFQSENEGIAAVRQNGIYAEITGKSAGTAVITATWQVGKEVRSKTVNVNVIADKIPVSKPKNARKYKKSTDWSGDRVLFGNYEQDNNLANGSEPIVWRVLEVDDDSVLLLSDVCLECRPYQELYEPASWKECDLREWLNHDFLKRAFTGAEAELLIKNQVKTAIDPAYGYGSVMFTNDFVYVLSIEEASNPAYGFYSKPLVSSVSRKAAGTEYARANNGFATSEGISCWWLRDNGISESLAAYILTNGKITLSYFIGRRNDGVRPVIRLDLSKLSFVLAEDGYYMIISD